MMLAKSMHQIARIEFRNSKFPYARGLCPLATPARGLCPLDPRQGASPLEPPSLVNNLGPPLSSGWIRPWSEYCVVCCHLRVSWACNIQRCIRKAIVPTRWPQGKKADGLGSLCIHNIIPPIVSVWIKKMKSWGWPPDNQVIIFTCPESFQVIFFVLFCFLRKAFMTGIHNDL